VQDHSRSVAIAAGALIVLSAAIAGGVWYSRSRDDAAQAKLAAVYQAAGAPVSEEETLAGQSAKAYATRRQKYEDVEKLAGEVLSGYPSSKAAKWAAYYKAVAQKELGNYPEALHTLEPLAADTSDDFLSATSKFMQAQVHEAQGDAAGALEIYASLAATASERFPADMVLMNQARVLEGQGKLDQARDIYRRVMQEYPDSPFVREATQRVNPAKG